MRELPTLYYITLHYITLHYIALHCIALHCIALHCIALHCIALHCIALHCIALHCIILYYIILYYIILYYSNASRASVTRTIWATYGQVRKNMSWFHMGDVISPYEMKSAESELAHDQNTTFHLGNLVDVFIWRIFIPPTYDLAFHRRDLGK